MLHYTGMERVADARARLCDPAAKVSAHHLVAEDGTVMGLVPEARRAWHAGVSAWRGRAGLNDVSIGVEIANPGHAWGYRPFPDVQVAAVVALARAIMARHRIAAADLVGHSDVAPDRKLDPGELFPWARLAAAGVGLWPDEPAPVAPDPVAATAALAAIGYPLAAGPFLALAAFQRRFRPWRVDGRLDDATMGRLLAVARLCAGAPAPS